MKVISGGQTGVDQIGLVAATSAGITTGGTAPLRFKTESGNNPNLALWGLKECYSSDYRVRTRINVVDSDGTVIFTSEEHKNDLSGDKGGSALTQKYCTSQNKPCLVNPITGNDIAMWVKKYNIQTLNVAGTRGSTLTDGRKATIQTILNVAFAAI